MVQGSVLNIQGNLFRHNWMKFFLSTKETANAIETQNIVKDTSYDKQK